MQTSTTPVPNVLFDVHVKELKSAELKVLLIIVRQTLGWSDKKGSNGRKEKDWISGSQLQLKTGCSRRAITSATDTLVKKQLIKVLDEKGNSLDNAEQRQGKTKLFYRLYNPVDNRVNINSTSAKFTQEMSKKVTALVQKMHITKETLQN
jgi:biotin operon repressor